MTAVLKCSDDSINVNPSELCRDWEFFSAFVSGRWSSDLSMEVPFTSEVIKEFLSLASGHRALYDDVIAAIDFFMPTGIEWLLNLMVTPQTPLPVYVRVGEAARKLHDAVTTPPLCRPYKNDDALLGASRVVLVGETELTPKIIACELSGDKLYTAYYRVMQPSTGRLEDVIQVLDYYYGQTKTTMQHFYDETREGSRLKLWSAVDPTKHRCVPRSLCCLPTEVYEKIVTILVRLLAQGTGEDDREILLWLEDVGSARSHVVKSTTYTMTLDVFIEPYYSPIPSDVSLLCCSSSYHDVYSTPTRGQLVRALRRVRARGNITQKASRLLHSKRKTASSSHH